MTTNQPTLAVSGLDKTFTMHLQGGQRLPVPRGLDFDVHAGECVVLGGASGAGKSSILKMVYGNYAVDRGSVLLRAGNIDVDIATANPREILAARRHAMGYVSQFPRCVPRVPALEVVAEPLIARGVDAAEAGERAGDDLDGDYLLPGVAEVHTDHAEYHLRPRPGVHWEAMPAVLAHDAQMTAAGATTVLDAVRLGSEPSDRETVTRSARRLADAITTAAAAGAFRADHAIHLRCEVSAEDCLDRFEEFADNPLVRLASLMDHTPGQRQFADLATFKRYCIGKGLVTESNVDAYVDELLHGASLHADRNRHAVAEAACRRGISLAAHDDATTEHVEESVGLGVSIAEFPTTIVAAESAVAHGLSVVMGAPNIVRGGSQSGNVAASALLERGLLHVLSSDYVPSSPMQAVFQLVADGTIRLQDAVKLISSHPAKAVGLDDRGDITIGKRGDLVRVRTHALPGTPEHPAGLSVPIIRTVYRQGVRVA